GRRRRPPRAGGRISPPQPRGGPRGTRPGRHDRARDDVCSCLPPGAPRGTHRSDRGAEIRLEPRERFVIAQPPKNLTSGDILRWRRVGGLVLAEVEYEAGKRIHREAHAHARFVLVLSGSLTEIHGEEATAFGSSTLLFRCAGEPHSYVVS